MNLRAVANRATGAVNPNTSLTLQRSNGYTTAPDGTRTPAYLPDETVLGNVQAMTSAELQQVASLNIEGVRNKIYFNGQINGAVRVGKQGGDLITDPDGNVWLVVVVLENWSDWTCVGVALQNGA